MAIGQHIKTFAGYTVKRYDAQEGITDPQKVAYRLGPDYDTYDSDLIAHLDQLLADPRVGELEALVTGAWSEDMADEPPDELVARLIEVAPKLTSLQALFFCEVTYEFNEISWMVQSDVAPLISAFPKLTHFAVRGGGEDSLRFTGLAHDTLEELLVQTGGMPSAAVNDLCQASLPNLRALNLWLGTEDYGGSSEVGELAPILSGKLFPKLKHLGLQNCDYAGDIAQAIVNAPVLAQLETLDLSMGTLTDTQAEVLLDSPAVKALARLDLSENYLTDAMGQRFEEAGFNVAWETDKDVEEAIAEEWYYVTHGE